MDFARWLHLFQILTDGVLEMPRSSVLGAATRVQPGPEDRQSAAGLRQIVAGETHVTLRLADGAEIELSDALIKILQASATELSAGHAVTVLASEVHLTPAEVGDLLGLSRPYVVRLLDRGDIRSAHLPGSRHRVVALADVLEFQSRRERRSEGRQRIAEIFESEGLEY